MPKRKFDAAITSDMKSVANDSFKDSIRMLAIEKLKASEENFYSMSDLELLADDIERQGLKHNLVVQEDADNPDLILSYPDTAGSLPFSFWLNRADINHSMSPALFPGIKMQQKQCSISSCSMRQHGA